MCEQLDVHVHLSLRRSAVRQVIRYTGHHLMTLCGNDSSSDVTDDDETGRCLVLIGEAIPQPSCGAGGGDAATPPLDSYSFVTQHSCDMRFTYCDDR